MLSLWRRLGDRFSLLRIIDRTFLRFGSVGAITTLLDFALFSALTKLASVAAIPANIVSYSSGIALSFFLNRYWTFDAGVSRTGAGKQGVLFVGSNLIGLILSSLIIGVFIHFMPELIAKAASIPLVFIWSYLSARYFVFKR